MRDAVVVGLPDERFGEVICAVVETGRRGPARRWPSCPTTCARRWPRYKAPRELVLVDSIGRAANGKVDYKGIRAQALEALAQLATSAT